MSLKYALLGLLDNHPASGYELTQEFAASLERWAWHAKHSQIYPELAKLEKDGLIEVAEEGARGRKTYAITRVGREDLRQWLVQPSKRERMRSEFMLRLFLMGSLPKAQARKMIERMVAGAQSEIDAVREAMADEDPIGPDGRPEFGILAGELGLRQYQALVDWADWAIEQLEG